MVKQTNLGKMNKRYYYYIIMIIQIITDISLGREKNKDLTFSVHLLFLFHLS